jgi:hypothetical protein
VGTTRVVLRGALRSSSSSFGLTLLDPAAIETQA